MTDEASRARSSTTDALGRLTRVVENPYGTPLYTTNYSYDALDNLTAVSQLGDGTGSSRSRSFDYDSLKRLKSATNPESGIITYGHFSSAMCISGYDDDGDLVERKDAAGGTVTALFRTTPTTNGLWRPMIPTELATRRAWRRISMQTVFLARLTNSMA